MWNDYPPARLSVGTLQAYAHSEIKRRRKAGEDLEPVVIEGRTIARSFWGQAWCTNLERYVDYANRLPRGRSYARNGAIIDLKIQQGGASALVQGNSTYAVTVSIKGLGAPVWAALRRDCARDIDSLVELLQGRLSTHVMERVSRPQTGLFPSPAEITMTCSCPDIARMCKHKAATLYGVGARLDHRPELLFLLRGVDPAQLVLRAEAPLARAPRPPARGRLLAEEDLGALFGLDLDAAQPPQEAPPPPPTGRGRSTIEARARDAVASRLYALRAAAERGAATAEDRRTMAALEAWLANKRAQAPADPST